MRSIHGKAQVVLVIAVVLMLLTGAEGAMAHAGESHADDGLSLSTTLGVAGVVVALGIAIAVTSMTRRGHERGTPGESGVGIDGKE